MCAILYVHALPLLDTLGVPLCFRTGPDGPQAVYTWFYRKGLHFCIATSGNQEAASQARSAVLPCSLCVQLVLVVHIVCRPYWHCSG